MVRFGPIILCVAVGSACAATDTDRDGLSDQFEQALLERFAPSFHISRTDCDLAPAEFAAGSTEPRVKSKNGTVYGQVFPSLRPGVEGGFLEIHFYHLWARDCGMNGHPLDAESVYGLLRADGDERLAESWRAQFWFAAAHENTLCDVSNGASAAALGADDRGPAVWVSRDKHASFLSKARCSGGCGKDTCDDARPLEISKLINLGEPAAPMNGAVWWQSASWPLASKMGPRFTSSLIARMPAGQEVEQVPARDVVRGGRTTIKVAGLTYGSLIAAETGAGAFLDAGASGLDAARDSAWKSAARTGRSLKSASSATRCWLKAAFGAGVPQPGR